MAQTRGRGGWVYAATALLVCFQLVSLEAPAYGKDNPALAQELAQAGFEVLRTGVFYGVPCVEIAMPVGESITSLCRKVPSLNRDFFRYREKIAFFNGVHPGYIRTGVPEPFSLKAKSLKIPLNPGMTPEIFPSYEKSLAGYAQYLLIDMDKGFLALYEKGELRRVFPVSAGRPGKETPLLSFRILAKDKDHWSGIYDVWMPWALLIRPPYYIHAGVLPGENDSAGCIRLFPRDAEELFHLVEVGTPGRIVRGGGGSDPIPAPMLTNLQSHRATP